MEPVVQRRPKGRGWIILGVVLTVAGLVAGTVCLVMFVRPFFDTFTEPILGAPGQHVLDLDKGDYDIWARTGERDVIVPGDPENYDDIEITVEILGPDGAPVLLRSPSDNSTIERGSTTFEAIHVAEIAESGEHIVRFITEDNYTTELIVARSILQTAADGLLWIVAGVISVIVLMAGVALIGGGWYTLNRQKKEAMLAAESGVVRSRNELLSDAWTEPSRFGGGPTPPPIPGPPTAEAPRRTFPEAGWYPDPDDPERRYRWWIGRTWSDETRER